MSTFNIHSIDSAPEDSQPLLKKAKESNGFVPNLYGAMATSPALLEAYITLGEIVNKTQFNAEELTVVWQSINVTNECHYCVPAHTAIAKSMKVDDAINQAATEGTSTGSDKLDALAKFTRAMVQKRGDVDKESVQAIIEAGYTDQHVLEVILLIGQKTLSNYTNHLAQTPVDDAFKR